MNESDYLRKQLSAERAHLAAVLERLRVHPEHAGAGEYLAWAAHRLRAVYERHLILLPARLAARALPPPTLPRLGNGGADSTAMTKLLLSWDSAIETPAASCYRIEDWRQVAQLRADDILKERQLYAAALA